MGNSGPSRLRPAHALVAALVCVALLACAPAALADTGDPLNYFSGPVAHSMTGVVVDWGPNINPAYTSETTGDPGLIKSFAAASGETAVVGGVLAQYMDSSGNNAANSVTYGQQYEITPSVTDTTIQDPAIQNELVKQINAGHLPTPSGDGLSTIYLILFPAGDTICFSGGTPCSGEPDGFCAYHGSTPLDNRRHVLYAVLPDNTSGGMAQGCGNESTFVKDQTSYLSHEWSETITDPLVAEANSSGPPLAWYDDVCTDPTTCGEVADKCNQMTGVQAGWTVQLVWSDLDSACVGTEPQFGPPTASFVAPANPLPGQSVGFDGSGSSDPSQDQTSATSSFNNQSYAISSGIASYDWNWGDGTAHSSGATPSHVFAQAGGYQVSLTVTDNLGFTSTVTDQVSVGTFSHVAPGVTTLGVTGVDDQGATLQGSLNPNDQALSYWFVYGSTSGTLDHSTTHKAGPGGHVDTPVSAAISGLVPSSTYYYQLQAKVGGTIYLGTIQSFSTNSAPQVPQVPVAGTGGASQITATSARLGGTINADGPATVSYHFSYGTSASALDHATADTPGPTGTSAAPVVATVSGLRPGTTYYYRLDVMLGGHTHSGSVQHFTTVVPAPTVRTGSVSGAKSNSAAVAGTVDPNGFPTTYHFEFGRSTAYGHRSAAAPAGAGNSPVAVAGLLSGLAPRTRYHYRLVASSAGGTVVGADLTLTTSARPPAPPRFSFSRPRSRSLRAALAHRLSVRFSCNQACTARFAVIVALSGITRGVAVPVTLARGSARLRRAASGRATLSFTSSARKQLAKAKSIRLVIEGYAVGSGGASSPPRSLVVILRG